MKDEYSDFQLICGTNRSLETTGDGVDGSVRKPFRQDLLARINLWSFRLPGLAERREDIEPNLDYELLRFSKKTGKHISFNKEARDRFLKFAFSPANTWPGNFRDLNAMVVRMATLADGGRITAELVEEEIGRNHGLEAKGANRPAPKCAAELENILGADFAERYDDFDLAQLAHVIGVCRESESMADAARKLFAVSIKAKKSANNTDRLSKYLAKFGLKFKSL